MIVVRTALAGAMPIAATMAWAAPESADPAGIIAGRQAAFRLSGATLNAMKGAIERGGDVTKQAFPAAALAGWAKAMPGLFPAGSDVAPSRALPAAWRDRPGFVQAAMAMGDAATRLSALARAGDQPGFAAQFAELRATCGACHDHYRQPEEHHGGH